jgi:hypothetical protein
MRWVAKIREASGEAKRDEWRSHKLLIYIEHHSVCPLVGIGTPPPL